MSTAKRNEHQQSVYLLAASLLEGSVQFMERSLTHAKENINRDAMFVGTIVAREEFKHGAETVVQCFERDIAIMKKDIDHLKALAQSDIDDISAITEFRKE